MIRAESQELKMMIQTQHDLLRIINRIKKISKIRVYLDRVFVYGCIILFVVMLFLLY